MEKTSTLVVSIITSAENLDAEYPPQAQVVKEISARGEDQLVGKGGAASHVNNHNKFQH